LIIDTDILVWHVRGNEKARNLVHRCVPFAISVVTFVELIQGMRDKAEMNMLVRQLASWNVDIMQISEDISTRAMIYVEHYRHSHSMELADALIAATAVTASEVLYTGNEKHYKHIPNIQVKRFSF